MFIIVQINAPFPRKLLFSAPMEKGYAFTQTSHITKSSPCMWAIQTPLKQRNIKNQLFLRKSEICKNS